MDIALLYICDKIVEFKEVINLIFGLSIISTVITGMVFCINHDDDMVNVKDTLNSVEYKIDHLIDILPQVAQKDSEVKEVSIPVILNRINNELFKYDKYISDVNKYKNYFITSIALVGISGFLSFIIPNEEIVAKIAESILK